MPDQETLLAEVRSRLRCGQGFLLATLNLDHLVKLRRDPAFAAAYAQHDLVVADGNPIVWLARLAGKPLLLVPGSDLVIPLVKLAAKEGVPIALVGATEQTLARAAAVLAEKAPGLVVAATIAPPMGFEPEGPEAERVVKKLAQSNARLVILALGAPRQERFAAFAHAALPQVGFASFGAALDFLAGSQRRAPKIMRALALEWLWRLLTNPRRLAARYAACAAILPAEVIRALAQRRGPLLRK